MNPMNSISSNPKDHFITSDDALVMVRKYVERCGSQKNAAKALEISPQFLCDVLQGHKQPYSIMRKLGWKHVVFYTPESKVEP